MSPTKKKRKIWLAKWGSDVLSGKPGGWKGKNKKIKICPITPALTPDQTAPGEGGDAGWDERLWGMGTANVAICPSPPHIYPSPSPTLVIFFFVVAITRGHTKILPPSPRGGLSLCVIWSGNSRPLSPALCYWHSRFQTRWGGIG